jgi:hypothetical protein
MRRTFPRALKIIGVPIVAAAWVFAARLIWEQTVWSWERGPQMVGFSLMHSGLGVLLILVFYSGLLWLGIVLIVAALTRSLGGKLGLALLLAYALAWGVIATPYGFWQRMFIDRYSPAQAIDFFTYAAATGDLRTVKAFLDRGVDINSQSRNGTALHGAAVQGEIEVIEFLIAHGADVNAINAYGDSPMANAMEACERAAETRALLTKHDGTLVRGSEEQRKRVIEEQVRQDMEKMDRDFRRK